MPASLVASMLTTLGVPLTAAATAAPIIKGAIGLGTSIASTAASFSSLPHNVTFKLDMENYTNQYLSLHQHYCHTGRVNNSVVGIFPAGKEAFCGHNTSDTATGNNYLIIHPL